MATTDTELKKLNKTVDEAVNMLKVYMGNPAQTKNMNEKQREAIDKWFDVGEQAEETQKKQRAFVERERDENGKFIKKKENQANKFMGIAQSVGGILGKAGAGLKSAAVGLFKGLKENLSSLFGQIKSHFLGLFGEESEWFGILGSIYDSVKGFFGWFARGFIFLFKRSPAWAKKMTGTLSKMYALQMKQVKLGFLDDDKKKKGGLLGALGLALFLAGAMFAGWLKARLMSLVMMWKGFKLTGIFKSLKLRMLKFFGDKGISGWFTKLWKILKRVPILGRLLQGLKFGLKWLGWPITILMGIIDFIKGFSETEGSLFEKVKGGLWAALEGFIELPVMFIGWVVEKILGMFGVEVDGIADKMMAWIHVAFDFLADFNPLAPLMDFIEGFMGTEGTFWEKIKGGFNGVMEGLKGRFDKWGTSLMQAIQPIIAGVVNFFLGFWNSAVQWIMDKVDWLPWFPGKGGVLDMIGDLKAEEMKAVEKTAQSPLDMANEYEKKRIDAKQKENKELKDSVKEGTKATEKAAKANEGTLNAVTTIASNQKQAAGGGGGVDTQQIPDELDNYIMDVKNYGGDFD
jgi:hypothetical protein